jgi:hypothetical protein
MLITYCHDVESNNKNLKIIDIEYPKKIKGILLPTLSDIHPPRSLNKLESPSRSPLKSPIAIPPPPNDPIKNGRIGVIISLPISLNKLDAPKRVTFLEPFFLSIFSLYLILLKIKEVYKNY